MHRASLNINIKGKLNISTGYKQDNKNKTVSLGLSYKNGDMVISTDAKYNISQKELEQRPSIRVKDWNIMATAIWI